VSLIGASRLTKWDHLIMGLLSWLFRRSRAGDDAPGTAGGDEVSPLQPTPTMRPLEAPKPTPTTRPLAGEQRTAGTPSYGTPHGTPSTQRIHNPTRPGR
jgi:hypothetical protein